MIVQLPIWRNRLTWKCFLKGIIIDFGKPKDIFNIVAMNYGKNTMETEYLLGYYFRDIGSVPFSSQGAVTGELS